MWTEARGGVVGRGRGKIEITFRGTSGPGNTEVRSRDEDPLADRVDKKGFDRPRLRRPDVADRLAAVPGGGDLVDRLELAAADLGVGGELDHRAGMALGR